MYVLCSMLIFDLILNFNQKVDIIEILSFTYLGNIPGIKWPLWQNWGYCFAQ